MANHTEKLLELESVLLEKFKSASIDFRRNGSEKRIPGNMSLSFRYASGEMLLHRLDLMGICVSTGSACDSKNTEISHVLRSIKMEESYARGTIRISLGKDNSKDDVDAIVRALTQIIK